jgi:hypothetical protein
VAFNVGIIAATAPLGATGLTLRVGILAVQLYDIYYTDKAFMRGDCFISNPNYEKKAQAATISATVIGIASLVGLASMQTAPYLNTALNVAGLFPFAYLLYDLVGIVFE